MATIRELAPHETGLAYTTMLELRPHLASLEAFVAQVNERQRPQGYRLVGVFEDGGEEPVAVAGFRITDHLAWGHCLYVDDLVTRASRRGRGYAGQLFTWLYAEAERLGCEQFHLDSGFQRLDAHRFYHNQGLHITSLHFARYLR